MAMPSATETPLHVLTMASSRVAGASKHLSVRLMKKYKATKIRTGGTSTKLALRNVASKMSEGHLISLISREHAQ